MQQDMSCVECTSVNLPFIMSWLIYVHYICYATTQCSHHLHLEFPSLNCFLCSFMLFWEFFVYVSVCNFLVCF